MMYRENLMLAAARTLWGKISRDADVCLLLMRRRKGCEAERSVAIYQGTLLSQQGQCGSINDW